MKLAKIALVLILGLCIIGGVFAGGRQAREGTRVFITGTSGPADTQSMGLFDMRDRLNAFGGWNAEARVSSEMGSTDDITEQALQGAPVINPTDPSRLAANVPEFGILMMPFLLDDYSQLQTIMATPLYAEWVRRLREENIILLTKGITGWRNWVTNRPIRNPADLSGQRIRTMGNPIAINSVGAMGAVPIAMAQSEAYHAIQTGVVDGGEWQLPTIYSLRLFEVANHISLSRHFLLTVSIIAGRPWYDTLSPVQQTQLRDAATIAFRDNVDVVIRYEQEFLNRMRTQHGVIVEENPDREAFRARTLHLYSDMATTGGADFEALRTELFRQIGRR